MSKPLEITPYQNGVHSLAQGLRSLEAFIENDTNPLLLKEVVMAIHHGIETLFKNLLFQRNPVFLLGDKTTVKDVLGYYQDFVEGKNQYLLDEAKTVNAIEAVERSRNLGLLSGMNEREYSNMLNSLKGLNTIRNQLQHFAINAYAEPLIRILGNLVPKSVKAINHYYQEQMSQQVFGNRLNIIPHLLPAQMGHLAINFQSVEADLDKMFERSTSVISMLESKYDVLLNAAIQRFKKASFNSLPLKIRIRDHGHVGAPPYMPEIELEGWLSGKFSPHENSRTGGFRWRPDKISAEYEANTVIHDPIIIKEPRDWHDQCVSRLSIDISIAIDVLASDSFFQMPEVEEEIKFIRSPEIAIQIRIDCEVEGMFDNAHYDISRVRSITGSVLCELESSVFGDDATSPSVSAQQTIPLDENNTSIAFHAFVESNKKLRRNYLLELNVDSKANVNFG